MDVPTARAAAAIATGLANAGRGTGPADMIAAATPLAAWILAAATPSVTTQLVPAAEVDGHPVLIPPGGTMPIAVAASVDNTTVTLQVLPEDDHGNPTPDQLSWSTDDPGNLLANWVLSADTHTYTGSLLHVEGTVNVTASDPSAAALAPAAFAITIAPGATAQLAGTATVT